MSRLRIDGVYGEFQNIHSLNDLKKSNRDTYYKGIKISFLESLLGEDWQELFEHGWGSKREFMKEYKVEYFEWNQFEK